MVTVFHIISLNVLNILAINGLVLQALFKDHQCSTVAAPNPSAYTKINSNFESTCAYTCFEDAECKGYVVDMSEQNKSCHFTTDNVHTCPPPVGPAWTFMMKVIKS